MALLAEWLGAILIAEGVETRQDLNELVRLGVRFAQGMDFAGPAPVPRAVALR